MSKSPNLRTEAQFSAEVVQFFRDKVAVAGLDAVQVREREKILKDFTVGLDREGRWRLVAGFQQQDIVFFDLILSSEGTLAT